MRLVTLDCQDIVFRFSSFWWGGEFDEYPFVYRKGWESLFPSFFLTIFPQTISFQKRREGNKMKLLLVLLGLFGLVHSEVQTDLKTCTSNLTASLSRITLDLIQTLTESQQAIDARRDLARSTLADLGKSIGESIQKNEELYRRLNNSYTEYTEIQIHETERVTIAARDLVRVMDEIAASVNGTQEYTVKQIDKLKEAGEHIREALRIYTERLAWRRRVLEAFEQVLKEQSRRRIDSQLGGESDVHMETLEQQTQSLKSSVERLGHENATLEDRHVTLRGDICGINVVVSKIGNDMTEFSFHNPHDDGTSIGFTYFIESDCEHDLYEDLIHDVLTTRLLVFSKCPAKITFYTYRDAGQEKDPTECETFLF